VQRESPAGKRSRLRGDKTEYHGRDGSERLLDDVEYGGGDISEDESESIGSPGSSARSTASKSQQSRLVGQLSQHSHISGQSATSSSTTTSSRPAASSASVYRPPDYPSSLFRQVRDDSVGDNEEFVGDFRDDGSFRSDSMYLDDRSSQYTGRTTNSMLSADYLDGSNTSARHLLGRRDHEHDVEERGSSEDDYHHRYDSCFSGDMGGDSMGLSGGPAAKALRLTGDDFASLLHPNGSQDSDDDNVTS
jgi:hypothetical protein